MKWELANISEAATHAVYIDHAGTGIVMHKVKFGEGATFWTCAVPAVVNWRSLQRCVHLLACPGARAIVTDMNNSGWISDGTRWRPVNGRALIAQYWGTFAAPVATLTGVTSGIWTLPAAITLPALMIPPHSTLWVRMMSKRTGANATADIAVLLGTAGTTSDGLLGRVASAATTLHVQSMLASGSFGTSTTTMVAQGALGYQTSAGASTTVDVTTNINTAAAMYVSLGISSANAADSFALTGYEVWLEA